jgi:Uma2 family endonuclease
MSVAATKSTWADIKDLPEHSGRTEIVEGELIMSPTPGYPHQRACTLLGRYLSQHIDDRALGSFVSSPIHVIFDEHEHYEPDLCFIARERTEIIEDTFIKGPPDLIIEVISESDRTHDTVVKFDAYARYGVREYWLVDLRENEISTWYCAAGKYSLIARSHPAERVQSRVLPDLQLNPAQVLG